MREWRRERGIEDNTFYVNYLEVNKASVVEKLNDK